MQCRCSQRVTSSCRSTEQGSAMSSTLLPLVLYSKAASVLVREPRHHWCCTRGADVDAGQPAVHTYSAQYQFSQSTDNVA